jgi:fluoride exporter
MTAGLWLAVAALGGTGAVARFMLDGWVSDAFGREFPLGTLAINVSGAFALGLLDGFAVTGTAMLLAGTATLGAYTTFSTWMLETQRMREEGEFAGAAANVAVSVVTGIVAVALGHWLGSTL